MCVCVYVEQRRDVLTVMLKLLVLIQQRRFTSAFCTRSANVCTMYVIIICSIAIISIIARHPTNMFSNMAFFVCPKSAV